MSPDEIIELDRQTLWHPYANLDPNNPLFSVKSAHECVLTLSDGRKLIDGMASWWSAIHGYNHPELNKAIESQLKDMAHVMFGGLTHEPAVLLAQKLVALTPPDLDRVFLADSGSVSVEVALKMARQYWVAKNKPDKQNFLAFESSYHGDTFGAMSVCDPLNGMHKLFPGSQNGNVFCPAPMPLFGQQLEERDLDSITHALQKNSDKLAAVIIEPIVQGAGGMRFYSAEFLKETKKLCETYGVLLIADEIATGFGRTGKLFACEHAGISPDILCVGKALTGGYMTLAATLCSNAIAKTISDSPAGALMHGPTFMANPLACATANTSIDLLLQNKWHAQVTEIESDLRTGLIPIQALEGVKDVRVMGAIGVIEFERPIDMHYLQPYIVDQGVWLRPFGRLLYTMPPYVMTKAQRKQLCRAMTQIAKAHCSRC